MYLVLNIPVPHLLAVIVAVGADAPRVDVPDIDLRTVIEIVIVVVIVIAIVIVIVIVIVIAIVIVIVIGIVI